MQRFIAFLRGINVGGHRVKMDRLRALFEALGFEDVSTFIASGNVIFSAPGDDDSGLSAAIEGHLAQELGYEVPTFLRTPAQLESILSREPEPAPEAGTSDRSVYVTLMHQPAPDHVRAALADLASETDDFVFAGCEVHWRLAGRLSDSPLFGKGLDQAFSGVPTTMRNVTTLRRLAAKIGP